MKIELITRRTGRPPTPWSWEIVDATCTLVQRSRTNFDTAELARDAGQAALLAYREADGQAASQALTSGRSVRPT